MSQSMDGIPKVGCIYKVKPNKGLDATALRAAFLPKLLSINDLGRAGRRNYLIIKGLQQKEKKVKKKCFFSCNLPKNFLYLYHDNDKAKPKLH